MAKIFLTFYDPQIKNVIEVEDIVHLHPDYVLFFIFERTTAQKIKDLFPFS